MERIVYFQDKALSFSSKAIPEGFFPWPFDARETGVRAKVINFLETHNKVCLLADDPEAAFEHFAAEFSWVEAAGGLVEAEHGAGVLMIYRNGRWDLPKGHVEAGEAIEVAAQREVEEETGVAAKLQEHLCETLHAYYSPFTERWELKQTHWFRMTADVAPLTPQTEEGIEAVAWVAEEELAAHLAASYPTIRAVFAAR